MELPNSPDDLFCRDGNKKFPPLPPHAEASLALLIEGPIEEAPTELLKAALSESRACLDCKGGVPCVCRG